MSDAIEERRRRYFAKHGYWPDATIVLMWREATENFDSKAHRMIDLISGRPKGELNDPPADK